MRTDSNAHPERLAGLVAVAVSLGAALTLWLRYHAATPSPERLAPTDLANYYYPNADALGRRLASGELPLWDPASCAGIPALASLQVGALYPFNWLPALLPTADALWLGMLVQVLLGAGFVAAALRTSGMHAVAAGLGGAFYAHACLLGNLAWPPSVAAMVWLPVQWLCVEKLVRGRRAGAWLVALAGATALQLLAGFPQYTVYGFYWLVPYAGVRLWESRDEVSGLRLAGAMVAAVILGVGLAAVQLAPTAELAAESARGASLTAEDVHYLGAGTLPAKRIVLNALDPSPKNPTFDLKAGTGYLGVASLFAGVAMLVLGARSARTVFLVFAGGLALLLSDGFHGVASPLFAIYHELPTGGLFRTPERLRFITLLCWIALACGGLDALLRREDDRARWWLWAGFGLAAVAVLSFGGPGSEWRLLLAGALVVALMLGPSRVGFRSGVAAAWLAFAVIDLSLATAPAGVLHAYPVEVSEQYRAAFRSARIEADQLAELQALPGHVRVEPSGFFPFNAAGDAAGLHRVACYEPLSPRQWRSVSEVLSPEAELTGGIANPGFERAPVFYDVASVARVVRPRRGAAVIRTNADALPRAYLVGSATHATQQRAFEHIRDGSFDFQTGVLLEDETAETLETEPSRPGATPAEPAEIVSYEPERVEIALAEDDDGWLVLTDTFYPGWEAAVDGRPAEILRANGLFRAVRVNAGDERLVFEYRPESLALGLAVSCASLIALVGLALMGGRLAGTKTR